ncbi:hypothetical protein [uncultured Lamprocystis sp.]|uniref:hypothetical protein n=2 Tax=uncultured Lamprocystis sp. TaxID=543132 RepID=UPI0025FB177A|nr:hypothetical protein [uncultured Lamprocystis sp.]
MMKRTTLLGLTLLIAAGTACAGVLDPECTAQKAAKGAAAKATVGVGGRCSPAEAAKDTAKRATGIEDKGTLKPGADTEKGAAKKTAK